MNNVERARQDLMEVRERILVKLIGETDKDSEHLHMCAEFLLHAIDELEGVSTI